MEDETWMVSVSTLEVAAVSLASPEYFAVMECVPVPNEDVVNAAEPFASVPAPNTVLPSRNCTVPVASEGVTVTANVTAAPEVAGFGVEVRAIEDKACTVCVTAAEVAEVSFASPA